MGVLWSLGHLEYLTSHSPRTWKKDLDLEWDCGPSADGRPSRFVGVPLVFGDRPAYDRHLCWFMLKMVEGGLQCSVFIYELTNDDHQWFMRFQEALTHFPKVNRWGFHLKGTLGWALPFWQIMFYSSLAMVCQRTLAQTPALWRVWWPCYCSLSSTIATICHSHKAIEDHKMEDENIGIALMRTVRSQAEFGQASDSLIPSHWQIHVSRPDPDTIQPSWWCLFRYFFYVFPLTPSPTKTCNKSLQLFPNKCPKDFQSRPFYKKGP